jgi:hypothetical protein
MKKEFAQEADIAILCILKQFLELLKDLYIAKCMMSILNTGKDRNQDRKIRKTKKAKRIKKIRKKNQEVEAEKEEVQVQEIKRMMIMSKIFNQLKQVRKEEL